MKTLIINTNNARARTAKIIAPAIDPSDHESHAAYMSIARSPPNTTNKIASFKD